MRAILNCDKFTSKSVMLSNLNWLNVKNYCKYQVLIFIYKLENNLLPGGLNNLVKKNSEVHDYNTRQKDWFHINRV